MINNTSNNSSAHVSAKQVLKKFLPASTVVLSIYFAITLVLFLVHRDGQLTLLRSNQQHELGKVGEKLQAEMQSIIGDLLTLGSQHELPAFINNASTENYLSIASEFGAFMRINPQYDMARILDTFGMEILRYESDAGIVRAIDRSKLQDKSSRYYVRDGLKLQADEILVSHLDLNVENGEIEIPVRATLRFVKPITNAAGTRTGLLALNYKASILLELLSRRTSLSPATPLVVDGDGNWILAENPEVEWSHLIPSRQRSSFAKSFPLEWRRITHGESQVLTSSGLFTVYRMNVADSNYQYHEFGHLVHVRNERYDEKPEKNGLSLDDHNSGPDGERHKLTLYFLSKASSEEVASITEYVAPIAAIVVTGLALILLVVVWILVRFQVSKQHTEALLHISEIKHRAIFNTSLDPMIHMDEHGYILSASATIENVFGWKPEELIGRSITILMPETPPSNFGKDSESNFLEEYLRGPKRVLEGERMRKDGTIFPCEITLTALNISGEEQRQFIGVIRDTTERKASEVRLRQSVELYRCLFTDAPYACLSVNDSGLIIRTNKKVANLFGYSEEHMFGRRLSDFVGDDKETQRLLKSLTQKRDQGGGVATAREIEIDITRANGQAALISMTTSVVSDHNGRLFTRLYSCIDVTAKREAEVALRLKDLALLAERKSEQEYLYSIIDNAPNLIYARDSAGRFTLINSAFEKFLGMSRDGLLGHSPVEDVFVGQGIFDITKNDMELFDKQAQYVSREEKYTNVDGDKRWLLTSKKLLQRKTAIGAEVLSVSMDVTELSDAKTIAVAADKMAAIGTLASGVAHEFKNYLAAIIGNAEYLGEILEDTQASPEAHDVVRDIIEAGDRANEVAMALLSYSRKKQSNVEAEDLVELTESTLPLITKRALQSNIQIATKFEKVPRTLVSAGKIQQLILNLLSNAVDAISSNGGVIVLTISRQDESVVLRISDSGSGIPEHQIEEIFNPFFSTKGVWGTDNNSGTGLGLAICRNIAEEHDGKLSVESTLGKGTTFVLKLPLAIDNSLGIVSHCCDVEYDLIVLLTHDSQLVQRLSQQSEELGVDCVLSVSLDKLTIGRNGRSTLLICDSAFPSASELYEVCLAYQAIGAKTLLMRKGSIGSFLDEESFDFVCNANFSLVKALNSIKLSTKKALE